MRKTIRVSRPPSGLYVGLCEEAAHILGGIGGRLRVTAIETGKLTGEIRVVIIKDIAGPISIKKNYMIGVTNNRLAHFEDIFEFGSAELKWEPTGNGITFTIPTSEQLPTPNPHPHVKGRKLRGIVDENSLAARLGAAIRTLNELSGHDELKNVRYYLQLGDDGQALPIGWRLSAKIITETILE
jgi:hypothetical protein